MVKKTTILITILLLWSIDVYAQFGGNAGPFPDNITVYDDGAYIEGTGKIMRFDDNIAATFDTLTSTYHISAVTIQETALCPDGTDGDFCFTYDDGDQVLKLYVNAVLQAQWPDAAQEFYLLLDDGVGEFKLLLDDGVGGFFLVIK